MADLAIGPTVRILPFCSRWSLRADPAAVDQLAQAWGAPLPVAVQGSATAGDRHALRLGPDEWLLLAGSPQAADGLTRLSHDAPLSLVDTSHRNVAYEVAGKGAATLLNAGVPLDLADTAFPPGRCTRTVLGKAEILLWRTADTTWRLEVWRSFSAYVQGYLSQAMDDL